MITAKEALAITQRQRDKNVDMKYLDEQIRYAASIGERHIRVLYELVDVKGYTVSFKAPGLEDELKQLGYIIEPMYEELQFVDVWMKVSW